MTRRGFICRLQIEPFGSGHVYPHEATHAGPKQDRLLLMRACRANFSPIFGLMPDADNEVQSVLERSLEYTTPLQVTDENGVVHRLWSVTDIAAISQVISLMGPKPIFIADGHHRYETAWNYRQELASQGVLTAEHPANFVMTACFSMNDRAWSYCQRTVCYVKRRIWTDTSLLNNSKAVSTANQSRRTSGSTRCVGTNRNGRSTDDDGVLHGPRSMLDLGPTD